MKALLLAGIVLALAILLWAIVLYFKNRPRPKPVAKEPWLESLEALMKMQGGNVAPSHLAGMAHAVASSLEKLSERIAESAESTERLGKINLLLVCVIAVATVAYTVATWLIVWR